MTFEDRLRSTFDAEADALRARRAAAATTPEAPTGVDDSTPTPRTTSWPRIALAAAALVFIASLAGLAVWAGGSGTDPDRRLAEDADLAVAAPDDAATHAESDLDADAFEPAQQPAVAEGGPTEGTAAPAAAVDEPTDDSIPTPTPESTFIYVIQPGDVMSSIAERFNVPMVAILHANPGLNPNPLLVDQQIVIPTDWDPDDLSEDYYYPPTPAPPTTTPVLPPTPRPEVEIILDDSSGSLWCVNGITDGDTLNIRAGPGTAYAIGGELEPEQCNVTRFGALVEGWAPIGSPDGISGWVSANFLTPDIGQPPPGPTATPSPTSTPGRPATMVTITIQMVDDVGLPDIPMSPLNTFDVRGPNDEPLGRLNANGQITLDSALLPNIKVQAELIDDAYCWWFGGGPLRLVEGTTYRAFVAVLCA